MSTVLVSVESNVQGTNRRINPVGRDGQVPRCIICDSRYHWARHCPHSYENNEMFCGDIGEQDTGGNSAEHVIQMSLFVGYTNDENVRRTKIVHMVEEM